MTYGKVDRQAHKEPGAQEHETWEHKTNQSTWQHCVKRTDKEQSEGD